MQDQIIRTLIPAQRSSNYKDFLSKALHAHSSLTTRQENNPDVDISDLFTDNKQLGTLQSADWQILYGRRGTGKTTLLHKLANVIDGKPNQASLTLSLQKCFVGLPSDTTEQVKGLVQFEKFIMELGYLLYRIYTNRTAFKNKNRKISKLFNYHGKEDRLVQASILNIATFAHRGTSFGSLKKTRQKGRKTSGKTSGFGIGAKGDISFLEGAEAFSAYANAQIQSKMEEMKETEYEEFSIIDFAALKRDFFDLLDALEITTLTILIDEWSGLDRRFDPHSQVYFAEYLRRCFFGTSRICLKISAIEHESRFFHRIDGESVGFEIDGDIFDDVNLDNIYHNRVINLTAFFEELLFKRLLHCNADLSVFEDKDKIGVPVSGFSGVIFEHERAFDELIKASGGIPRDFIKIFDSISLCHDYSVSAPWKLHRVREQIVEHSIKNLERFVKYGTLEHCILQEIRNIITTNLLRLFLIPKGIDEGIAHSLTGLFAMRMIHRQNLAGIPDLIRDKYEIYHIDYGIYLDWTRDNKENRRKVEMICPINDSTKPNDVLQFVVDIEKCRL